ncbi:MAG: hypothetical protein V4708_16395 [Bacteroidota bacterium]
MKFKVYVNGRIEITGSLHKYMNNGEHNMNDFSVCDLEVVLLELSSKFGPEILIMDVQNLEFGINIATPFTPYEFTNKVILYLSRGARFKHAITKDDAKGFDRGIRFILDQYQAKYYDKAGMYNQPGNLLRTEFKTVKMEIVKGAKIKTIGDLIKPSVTQFLFNKLIECIDNTLVNESIDLKNLNQVQQMIVLQCVNPEFWNGIDKYQRTHRKKQFDALSKKYGTTDIKAIVKDLLHKKYAEMVNANERSTINLLTVPVKKVRDPLAQTINTALSTY